MREPGRLEVVVQPGIETADVTHDEARQEPTRLRRQAGAGALQPASQGTGGSLDRWRRADVVRCRVDRENGRAEVAAA